MQPVSLVHSWVLLWSTALGWLLQILAARVGVVTGKQLARICREEYPWYLRFITWLAMEIAIIGSDVQVLLGSSIAISLLSHGVIPLWGGVLITGVDSFFLMLLDRIGVRKFEAVFAGLLFTMLVCFATVWGIAGPHIGEMALGLAIPQVPPHTVQQAVGTVGAVIMPHNIFLHSALVRSRKVNRASKAAIDEANYFNAIESGLALLLSLFINLFVVAVFAHNFYDPTGTRLCPTTDNPSFLCRNVGLLEAGSVLTAGLGAVAGRYVWSIGLLASGQSSVLTTTYAGQFVMSGFWNIKVPKWKRALITRMVALVPGIIVAITAQNEFDEADEFLNILQSIALPFALLPLLRVTMSWQLMGPYANSPAMNVFAWTATVASVAINVYTFVEVIEGDPSQPKWLYAILAVVSLLYATLLFLLVRWEVGDHRGEWDPHAVEDADDEDAKDGALDVDTPQASLLGESTDGARTDSLDVELLTPNAQSPALNAPTPAATRLWWEDPSLYLVPSSENPDAGGKGVAPRAAMSTLSDPALL